MTIYFLTHNKSKFEEARDVAIEYGITLEWKNKEYEEIQASSLKEIALKSCLRLLESDRELKKVKFFVEDAGLFIHSLNGFPGPYSSYVFNTIGNKGIIDLMKTKTDKTAYFESVIAYYDGRTIKTFEGKTEGEIILQKKGDKGFGFDPIFQPKGKKITFAEMSLKSKNLYSHRQKSLREMFTSLTAFESNK
ncbi:MAG: RdgB/HAM1 family non-canonical purine NTP pyrophosphatase [Candidatus Heimdallarchaeaceae archaeon]